MRAPRMLSGRSIVFLMVLSFAPAASAVPIFVRLGAGNIARAVSDDGSVVVGVYQEPFQQAWRWTQSGGVQYLGDFPGGNDQSYGLSVSGDGNVVVGSGARQNATEAYRWTAATGLVGLGDLPGGNSYSVALGISRDGSTIVGVSSGSNGTESVRWDGGAAPPIGLGGFVEFNGQAWATSGDGSIIVGSDYATVNQQTGLQAFRWTQATGMVGLGDAPGGGCCSDAYNISPEGSVIVGEAYSGSGILAMRWTQGTGIVLLGDLPGGRATASPTRRARTARRSSASGTPRSATRPSTGPRRRACATCARWFSSIPASAREDGSSRRRATSRRTETRSSAGDGTRRVSARGSC